MLRAEAERLMTERGFMVHFEERVSGGLRGDWFPDKQAGEQLIATEAEAWEEAARFAANAPGRYGNIYVVDSHLRPVPDYVMKMYRIHP